MPPKEVGRTSQLTEIGVPRPFRLPSVDSVLAELAAKINKPPRVPSPKPEIQESPPGSPLPTKTTNAASEAQPSEFGG